MSEHEKPVWITRDGVDVAVVISLEMFNELASNWEYSTQGELNLLKFTIRSGV